MKQCLQCKKEIDDKYIYCYSCYRESVKPDYVSSTGTHIYRENWNCMCKTCKKIFTGTKMSWYCSECTEKWTQEQQKIYKSKQLDKDIQKQKTKNRNIDNFGGWIYIAEDGSGLFKIGQAKNLDARLKQHRISNPYFHYICAFQYQENGNPEKDIHNKYSSKRVMGEWFALTFGDFTEILHDYSIETDESWLLDVKNKSFSEPQP